jgi:ClpP class serine protease
MAQALMQGLDRFKDTLAKGEVQRVKDFQGMFKEILAKQEKRKEEVTSKLKEFQKDQQGMAKRLKEILAKGRELRIRDLKLMLKEFEAQHKERLARQEERREEVGNLLGEFHK